MGELGTPPVSDHGVLSDRVLGGYGLGVAVGATLGPKIGVGQDAPRPMRRCLDEESRLNSGMPLRSRGRILAIQTEKSPTGNQ